MSKIIPKIAHLTSVHSRYDTRIFLKECTSLAKTGYEVHLVVADGKGDEQKNGVNIHDVGASNGRFDRMRHAPGRVLKKALELNATIYHLHDPELIPIGLKLKKADKKIIFDAHEDVPKQLLNKPYLNKPLRWLLSKSFSIFEKRTSKKLDAIVAATPFIRDKYLKMGVKSVDINNYPLLGELALKKIDWAKKKKQVCYVGGISRIRGILEVVQAMEYIKQGTYLSLAGEFSERDIEIKVRRCKGWAKVKAIGFLSRKEVAGVLSSSIAGLVTFLPAPNHIDAQPNKMFEYMSAGIPVIASNFPLWRKIIEDNQCGICVNPLEPQEIARAIDYLTTHPKEAGQMGKNGQKAVKQKYNWGIEEKKLLEFYREIFSY